MKYIGINTIFKEFYNNELFNLDRCTIGQNLLLPYIKLKESLLDKNYIIETIDNVDLQEASCIIFQDIPDNSLVTIDSIVDLIKYILKNRKYDYLYRCIKNNYLNKMILIIMEPPSVNSTSYNVKLHKYFNKILTWNDDLVDNIKYFKFNYPQPKPEREYFLDFDKKSFCTLIATNKKSNHANELYSKRVEVINYFENSEYDFEFYGIGWNKNYKNYKGYVKDKLEILSKYKFCICYENIKDINGYITEKIFDCFFANCVPIYWGAKNIEKCIPENTFIDRRKFQDFDDLVQYLLTINEKDYMTYLENIRRYLLSEEFNNDFSINAYIRNIERITINENI